MSQKAYQGYCTKYEDSVYLPMVSRLHNEQGIEASPDNKEAWYYEDNYGEGDFIFHRVRRYRLVVNPPGKESRNNCDRRGQCAQEDQIEARPLEGMIQSKEIEDEKQAVAMRKAMGK